MRTFVEKDENGVYSWDRNPFYNPEKCDLTLLLTIREPGLSYEFNYTIFVKDNPTGDIYAVSDSGCSCPTPFENILGLGDMVPIRNMQDFDTFFKQDDYRVNRYSVSDILSARREISELL